MNSMFPPLPKLSALACLNRLEGLASSSASNAAIAAYRARELRQALSFITSRPAYELIAEAHLVEAEAQLVAALDEVRAVRAQFSAIPGGTHYMEAAE